MDGKMTFDKKLVDKRSLSSDDESDGRPQVPEVVADRFDVSRKLGSGSYSVVRLAWDRAANRYVALKFEWTKAEKTDKRPGRDIPKVTFCRIAELCQVFGLHGPTTTVHWCGSQGEYNIMAMGLLGPSLEDLFMKTCRRTRRSESLRMAGTAFDRKFSLKTVLMLGEQMINCIEAWAWFLLQGSVCRPDVESADIGFFSSLCRQNGRAADPRSLSTRRRSSIGMLGRSGKQCKEVFCPCVHVQAGTLHNQVQDIKPSNFVVGAGDGQNHKVYIVDFGLAKRFRDPDTGKHIPFVKKRINHRDKKKRKKRIGKRKAATSHQDLCKSFPKEFVQYLEYCDSLGFKDKPDYDHLRSLFRKAASRHQLDFDWQFDWLTPRQKRKRAPVLRVLRGLVQLVTQRSSAWAPIQDGGPLFFFLTELRRRID
eukprot:s3928_g12.t2